MATYYWVGGTGIWSGTGNTQFAITSGGAATVLNPTTTDTVIFDANSGTAATVTVTSTAVAAVTTINKADINISLSGNAKLANTTSAVTLTTGILTLNSYTLTAGLFNSNNANTRTINFGTGDITVTAGNAAVWQTQTVTNLTITGTPIVNATYSGSTGSRVYYTGVTTEATAISFNFTGGTDTIGALHTYVKNVNFTGFAGTFTQVTNLTILGNLTLSTGMTITPVTFTWTFASTSGTKTITTNSKTINNPITFNGIGGTFAFQDALTQGSTRAFTITNGTVQLKTGTTNTVGAFTTSGTTRKYLQSTIAGTQATLSQASGTVSAAYLNIQDIIANGGATWNAFTTSGNVDAGNNLNWNFGGTPSVDIEVAYRLRSFTQPRRF